MVQNPYQNALLPAPVGGGYVVRKIEKDQAVLMRGSEKTVLLLHKKQEKKP